MARDRGDSSSASRSGNARQGALSVAARRATASPRSQAQFASPGGLRALRWRLLRPSCSRMVVDEAPALDELIVRYAVRSIEQLDAVGRAILLLGLAELKHRADVPTKVVINEAVELAKRYGATESSPLRQRGARQDVRASCSARRRCGGEQRDRRVRDHRTLLHVATARDPDVVLGVGDDAAVIAVDGLAAVTVDTLVAGVHFPDGIARELARLSLDGGESQRSCGHGRRSRAGATLALTLPAADELWLDGIQSRPVRARGSLRREPRRRQSDARTADGDAAADRPRRARPNAYAQRRQRRRRRVRHGHARRQLGRHRADHGAHGRSARLRGRGAQGAVLSARAARRCRARARSVSRRRPSTCRTGCSRISVTSARRAAAAPCSTSSTCRCRPSCCRCFRRRRRSRTRSAAATTTSCVSRRRRRRPRRSKRPWRRAGTLVRRIGQLVAGRGRDVPARR